MDRSITKFTSCWSRSSNKSSSRGKAFLLLPNNSSRYPHWRAAVLDRSRKLWAPVSETISITHCGAQPTSISWPSLPLRSVCIASGLSSKSSSAFGVSKFNAWRSKLNDVQMGPSLSKSIDWIFAPTHDQLMKLINYITNVFFTHFN